MPRIIHQDLSYKVVGILFDIHKKLGNRYQEEYYQRAFAEALKKSHLKFQKELSFDLEYDGKK
ncbi:hypothetical protein A2697_00160 [Candidatus Curtissbacteria bacterium RIFCSPHIGHO2_01_FULL_41_44]|uniref:GxxExxY protein n=1 Tax=Candidatus Curtissbacteria bacterium RIFCSPLOWO2_01_FULL_42_50 TaxID=1797730 RepID=A0A1F5H6W9_9BACT|nr:MAG: hypothetical protein A3C33_02005 [Candidatus Curtissbacteria bacterium RIFCSPHIGHO2_02_FULL_42_58]OGD94411.1 MAG: hypothetical protein A2697_00160 [Candidatus Curtissbacteria bacterium RIFCSPHIGHO2_01_FULL_41_44]OGD97685.1 MAG: hypothetical protein A3E71_01085 [Candidatus Curtissbacteria bacterium RIFCSPHIGHO2_12_FULL_42_33]OGD99916.1 MAG: hypothetical protein A3B54_00160 [Candidatus Curtissbacteria bacterium RIFCSPLOWO2_01_FULL_42_50]OGE02775.1 MAG: hypothetical protein A3G16_03125 [Ca